MAHRGMVMKCEVVLLLLSVVILQLEHHPRLLDLPNLSSERVVLQDQHGIQ